MSPLYGNIKLLSQVRGRWGGGLQALDPLCWGPAVAGGRCVCPEAESHVLPLNWTVLDADGTPGGEGPSCLLYEMDKITSASRG